MDTLVPRLIDAATDRTAAVLVSSVLFETAEIVPGLNDLASACERIGAELLVDAYHHLNVVPFDVAASGLSRAFVVGGGYKYLPAGRRELLSPRAAGLPDAPVVYRVVRGVRGGGADRA